MTIRKIKKDLRMGREISVQNLRLAQLPHSLCVRLSEKYGLIKEEYQAGETIVDINSGDMIELSEPYKNRTPKIHYRNIWEWLGNKYIKEYDDDYGGTLTILPCDLFFPATDLWKKYNGVYRLATQREKKDKGD